MLGGRGSNRVSCWLVLLMMAPGLAGAASVELISGTGTASDVYGESNQPAVSADGRYVAFQSDAPNLVPGQEDGNNSGDVFLHDRVTGTTTLVSHAAGSPTRAATGYGGYGSVDISADGRYVAFSGAGTDLVPGAVDANHATDVFLWDRVTGTTTLVSHAAGLPGTAADGNSFYAILSADGNFLVFTSRASNLVAGQVEPGPFQAADVFLWSRASGTTTLLTRKSGTTATAATQDSLATDISADGGVVVFSTAANDFLPPGTDNNEDSDIYAYQRSTNTLSLVSRTGNAPQSAAGGALEALLSADGRYVAFASYADNLVPGQVAGGVFNADAYLYDRTTGEMRLVSHRSASPLLSGGIFGNLAMSADGRYVAFSSPATDLVPGQADTNQSLDVFVYDRVTGVIALASHSRDSVTTAGSLDATGLPSDPGQPRLSADGRFVVFQSLAVDLVSGQTDVPKTLDVFLYDQASRSVTLMSRLPTSASTAGNGRSSSPVLSADGSVAAFLSQATDLVAGQTDAYGFYDLFLYRRSTGEITSPSRRDPSLPPALTFPYPSTLSSLSADGRSVLFQRSPSYRGDVFLRDTAADTTLPLRLPPGLVAGSIENPVLSADGRFAAFVSIEDTFLPLPPLPPEEALYLYDRAAGSFTLVNYAPGSPTDVDGSPSTFALSADGRYVAYQCASCGLVPGHPGPSPASPGRRFHEIFLYDRVTGLNTLVSHAAGSPTARADGQSYSPAISADGRFVVFWSLATLLIPGQTDVRGTQDLFVFDRVTGGIELVTHVPGSPATAAGLLSASSALVPADVSADGRFIAFQSALPNLVPGQVDTNEGLDVFLRDQVARTTVLVSHAAASQVTAGNGPSSASEIGDKTSMSADGRFVVYESLATDLVAGVEDANGGKDVFLYDRLTGASSLVSHAGGAPLKAGNGESVVPRISADGSHVAFLSAAVDLIPGQTVPAIPAIIGGSRNLYVLDRSAGTTIFIGGGVMTDLPFFPPASDIGYEPIPYAPLLSANGRRIAFTSDAPLVPGDYNGTSDVYLWDQDGTAEPESPVAVPPCKLLDTRRRAERPILTSNVQRAVAAHGRCGVPATAREVVVQVTVFNPSGKGNLRFYPGPVTAPPSAILRFPRGTTRTETFTLPLSTSGTLTILPFVSGRGTVHVAVEVTAYAN
jgi:Tol biopolymer transport system component